MSLARSFIFFQFELDHAQTRVLMDMFTPSPPPNNFWMPPVAAPADEHVRELVPSPVWAPKHEGKVKPEEVVKSYADMVKKNKCEEVGKGDVDEEHASSDNESCNGFDDLDCGDTATAREGCALSDQEVEMKQQRHSNKKTNVLSFNQVLEGHAALPMLLRLKTMMHIASSMPRSSNVQFWMDTLICQKP